MESEISSEQELQQLKIISENQEKLLKKIEGKPNRKWKKKNKYDDIRFIKRKF